jgi:hypothetical protein
MDKFKVHYIEVIFDEEDDRDEEGVVKYNGDPS